MLSYGSTENYFRFQNGFSYLADVKPIINKHMSMLSLCVYYDLYEYNCFVPWRMTMMLLRSFYSL